MILILTIIAVLLTLWSVVRVLGSRESEDASVALVLIGLLHVAGFTLLFFAFPVAFIRSISEDQWVEWMTFWCALLAAGIGVRAFIRLVGQDRWVAVSVLALSLFCLFFALEEISWGQRLLSFEGPEFITSRNSQSETNLHNLFMGPGKSEWNIKSVVFAGIVIFAIGVPAWLLDRGRGSWLARWPFPPAGAAPIFLASALCFKYLQHYRLDELGEYLLALGLLVCREGGVRESAYLASARTCNESPGRRGRSEDISSESDGPVGRGREGPSQRSVPALQRGTCPQRAAPIGRGQLSRKRSAASRRGDARGRSRQRGAPNSTRVPVPGAGQQSPRHGHVGNGRMGSSLCSWFSLHDVYRDRGGSGPCTSVLTTEARMTASSFQMASAGIR